MARVPVVAPGARGRVVQLRAARCRCRSRRDEHLARGQQRRRVASARRERGLPVLVQVPVAGSYSSALARTSCRYPPTTSTLPVGSSVAVWRARPVAREPVALQVPVAGSYSSALREGPLPSSRPPPAPCPRAAASPCGRSARRRREPVALQVPWPGHTAPRWPDGRCSHAPRHQHLARRAAASPCGRQRPWPSEPVALQVPVAGSYSSALPELPLL